MSTNQHIMNQHSKSIFKGQIIYSSYNKYVVGRQLGKGGFGSVYRVTDLDTNVNYALKVALPRGAEQLDTEVACLTHCGRQYPEFLAPRDIFLLNGGRKAFVMELKGRSLESHTRQLGGQIQVPDACLVAFKVLGHLEHLHSYGWIHRDIKPDNIVLGSAPEDKGLYLVDMGLATRYLDSHGLHHLPYSQGAGVVNAGTRLFMSTRCHDGVTMSRRDDLESLAYMLVYLMKGRLPWSDQDDLSLSVTALHKKVMSAEEICVGLPQVFEDLLNYARNLSYDEAPDYRSYISTFKRLHLVMLRHFFVTSKNTKALNQVQELNNLPVEYILDASQGIDTYHKESKMTQGTQIWRRERSNATSLWLIPRNTRTRRKGLLEGA